MRATSWQQSARFLMQFVSGTGKGEKNKKKGVPARPPTRPPAKSAKAAAKALGLWLIYL
jgi:hypothetical protein